jgi:2-oxoglutarate/2-oxoacid ferredoxin oxidoreductase subunit beta
MTATAIAAPSDGIGSVPRSSGADTAGDYKSDQEVRWCPGCGDYIVLNAVQAFLPTLGLRRENLVFVSGIGCSSRFPYYLDTYGMHSIHGRAPTIATGMAVARPDLSVWVVTGDGDALSIGGNHLVHALRRNVNLTILLFNNRVYGLTKGQYSPTSTAGTITKSTPMGSVDTPLDPVSLALGAEATFVGRALDSDRAGLVEVLGAAARHRGSALVEIYQNCPVFNPGAFDGLKSKDTAAERLIRLRPGHPIRFGRADELGVTAGARGGLRIGTVDEIGADSVIVHDPAVEDPAYAFGLSRLGEQDLRHVPVGIFRQVRRPTYDDQVRDQVARAGAQRPPDLRSLLHGTDVWTVGGTRGGVA